MKKDLAPAILATGLVTSVGLSAAASCAAMRVKLTNPIATGFADGEGGWIMGHQVALDHPWRGVAKLAQMAALAIDEALVDCDRDARNATPLVLCVAEADRPGRTEPLDEPLFSRIQELLGVRFSQASVVVPHGRVGLAAAFMHARGLLAEGRARRVLVAGVDSLLDWPTLRHYQSCDRILMPSNSDGFMPGEAAGALLLGIDAEPTSVRITGIGIADEPAIIDSGEPLRGSGLTQAIRRALTEAGKEMHDIGFRVSALSGEQYYFKEAALALNRLLRRRREDFELWHPAESTGETGAASGAMCAALVHAACTNGFAPGDSAIVHLSGDGRQRAAVVMSAG